MSIVSHGLGGKKGGGGGASVTLTLPITAVIEEDEMVATIEEEEVNVASIECGNASAVPSDYPLEAQATAVWRWGEVTGDLAEPVTGDNYIAGGTVANSHLYQQTGPPGTNMKSLFWRNDATYNSHHTAPGTTSGESSGPISASMAPGTSDFKLFFCFKHVSGGVDSFHYLFDFDQPADAISSPNISFFISSAGGFSPAAWVLLLVDDAGNYGEWKWQTPSGEGFEDNIWYFCEWEVIRTETKPKLYVASESETSLSEKTVDLVFSSNSNMHDLTDIGTINPTNGIRFAQKERSETATGRSNLYMAAAAYAKTIHYEWNLPKGWGV